MSAPLIFYVNESASDAGDALVASFTSTSPADTFTLAEGDRAREVEFHFLKRNTRDDSSRPFVYIDPTGTDVRLGVGTINEAVLSGTWTFTDIASSQVTAAIPYNASAAAVQAAIRAGCTTNFGTATVSGANGGPYSVSRGVTGTFATDPTADTSGISPRNSVVEIVNTQDGDTLLEEQWELSLIAAPAILKTSGWDSLPAAAVEVSTITGGSSSTNEVQRVTWSANAYGGSVRLSLALPHVATILTSSDANPSVITTDGAHELQSGDSITIAGHAGSTPALAGPYTVTRISETQISVPVNVTVAGTGGTLAATLTRTVGPVPHDVTAQAFELLFEAHPASTAAEGAFSVVSDDPGDYSVTFGGPLANLNIAQMTATHDLKVPLGLRGTIDCLTSGVRRILSGSRVPVRTDLEIKRSVDGVPRMVAFSDEIRIRPELLSSTPGSSDPAQIYLTTVIGDLRYAKYDEGGALAATGLNLTHTISSGTIQTVTATNLDWTGNFIEYTYGSTVVASINAGGVFTGDGSGLVNVGTGNVTVRRPNGTVHTFKASDSTNGARGDALALAIADTGSGDHVSIGPGTYTLAAALSIVDGVSVSGAGIDSTIIEAAVEGGILIMLGGGSVRDLTVRGTSTSVYQMPLYIGGGGAEVTIRGVKTEADTDGLYLGFEASNMTVNCYDCIFRAAFDAVNLFCESPCYVALYNCDALVTGPSVAGADAHIARGVAVTTAGELRCYNCRIRATNGGSDHTAAADAENGTVRLYGCDVSSASSGPVADLRSNFGSLYVTGGRGTNTDGTYTTSGTIHSVNG